MTKRLKALSRIASAQERLVALANVRLAAIEQTCRNLAEDQVRLHAFLEETSALGPQLARSALKATHDLDLRLTKARRLRDRQKDHRDEQKRREHVVSAMRDAEAVNAKRAEEDRQLSEIMEAWLARSGASLP